MGNLRTLHGVQLQPCCRKSIKIINGRIKKSNALQIAAPACIFVQMFLGPPKSEIATLYSVNTTDWSLLAEMVKGCKIRSKLDTDSDLNWTVIPEKIGHSFRF